MDRLRRARPRNRKPNRHRAASPLVGQAGDLKSEQSVYPTVTEDVACGGEFGDRCGQEAERVDAFGDFGGVVDGVFVMGVDRELGS